MSLDVRRRCENDLQPPGVNDPMTMNDNLENASVMTGDDRLSHRRLVINHLALVHDYL